MIGADTFPHCWEIQRGVRHSYGGRKEKGHRRRRERQRSVTDDRFTVELMFTSDYIFYPICPIFGLFYFNDVLPNFFTHKICPLVVGHGNPTVDTLNITAF